MFSDFKRKPRRAALTSGQFAVLIIILLAFSLVLLTSPQKNTNRPVIQKETGKVVFVINKGDSFKTITNHLWQGGLINSPAWFKLYSLVKGLAPSFKPGVYELSPAFSSSQIAKVLARGPADIKVTIQEGETLVDIDKKLVAARVLKTGDLVNFDWRGLQGRYSFLAKARSLEGFLFPDTYQFVSLSEPAEVVKKFLDNFQKSIEPHFLNAADFYEKLTLASLVEKEALHPHDRLVVAGILEKRLAIDMPLQADAAIVYAKCQGAYLSCEDSLRQLTKDDLKNIHSPYNNYLYKGLPPTPIANPGKNSIVAAFNPKSSPYLYYISDPKTNRMIFSQTLDEHNENRFKYLRG